MDGRLTSEIACGCLPKKLFKELLSIEAHLVENAKRLTELQIVRKLSIRMFEIAQKHDSKKGMIQIVAWKVESLLTSLGLSGDSGLVGKNPVG